MQEITKGEIMKETTEIMTYWHKWPGVIPVTHAQTGCIDVPLLIMDTINNNVSLIIGRYLSSGVWVYIDNEEEISDDIIAWGNIEANEILQKMGLKYWQKKAKEALKE
jgi:hypothetical protein